jgi:amidase
MTGQPAISLPLHWTPAGLPVGVQLAAAYGREDL